MIDGNLNTIITFAYDLITNDNLSIEAEDKFMIWIHKNYQKINIDNNYKSYIQCKYHWIKKSYPVYSKTQPYNEEDFYYIADENITFYKDTKSKDIYDIINNNSLNDISKMKKLKISRYQLNKLRKELYYG